MAGRLAPLAPRQTDPLRPARRSWLRAARPGRGDFRVAKDAPVSPRAAPGACLLLLGRHGKRRPVRSGLLRAHVVPSNEEGDRLGVVDGLNRHRGRRRMERASGLHDLSDDRKAGDTSGFEARGALRQIDRILDVLGDDEVGVARPVAARERDDEVRDRPALLGLKGIGERRHRRAVEPRAHRPEDVLAGRASAEGPALREVRGAYRMAQVVLQGWSRRSVAPTERAVALDAASVHVELLAELDGLVRGGRRARERHGLGDILGVREVGGEGRDEVGEIRHLLVGERRARRASRCRACRA